MVNCVYCGEEEGTEKIISPNMDWTFWMVCKTCKEVIKQQQKLDIASILSDEKISNKWINEANEKLSKIAKETGKEILTACIYKDKTTDKYESISITRGRDKKK